MRYVITMTDSEGTWDSLPTAEQDVILKQHEVYEGDLKKAGKLVFTCHLKAREEAKTVWQSADGTQSVVDGPYTDAPVYAGGFYIIDADSMEEALEWARRGRFMPGANEVREIFG